MRPALLLLILLATPTAAAAIRVDEIEVPERTMADKPFPVRVRVTNDGDARDVHFFGALYRAEAGAAPCGPSTGGRFQTFTHLVNERVRIPARSSFVYPDEGEWLHRYAREDVEAAPRTDELCVFVANATVAQQAIQYEAYGTVPLPVRGVNAIPTASFSWDPETPRATRDVTFRAEGTDADGDPVGFRWDFGHLNASGRARAEGPRPTTFFFPAGEYVVTLTASDGLEETSVARTVTVIAADAPSPDEGAWDVPLAGWVPLVALVVALSLRRR